MRSVLSLESSPKRQESFLMILILRSSSVTGRPRSILAVDSAKWVVTPEINSLPCKGAGECIDSIFALLDSKPDSWTTSDK
jgi:hypothetical protein